VKGDVSGIKDALRESMEAGMQSFDVSLFQLYKDGQIDLETALANADSATDLEAKINFG
jgi:twitching motility protein PilU